MATTSHLYGRHNSSGGGPTLFVRTADGVTVRHNPRWLGEIIAEYHADAIPAGQASLPHWLPTATLLVQASITIDMSEEHRQWAIRAAAAMLRTIERNRPQGEGGPPGWQVPLRHVPRAL